MAKEEKVKISKFEAQLGATDTDIKRQRGKIAAGKGTNAVSALITKLSNEKFELESALSKLSDLGPDSNVSLRPIDDSWNPAQWVNDLFSTKMKLRLKNIELEEAQSIMDEWFGDAEA